MARFSATQASKLPSKQFVEIVDFLRLCARLIGLDLLDPNYRKNFLTGCILFWIIAYPICVISTIVQKFRENWMIVLEALCVAIAVFQASTKFFCALSKRKIILSTYLMLVDIYQDYELRHQLYADALFESYLRVRRAMRIMLLTCLVPSLGILAMPFIMQLIDSSNRFLMIPMLFPHIDVNSTSGYYTTLCIQGTIIFLGSFGIFASDLIVLMYFMQSYIFADILRLKIKELNTALLVDEGKRCKTQIYAALMDIVKWQQLYSSFTDRCNECFYWFVVVCVTTSGAGIVLSLFMLLTTDWPGAYPYLIVEFYTLYMYCILGTKIEICVSMPLSTFSVGTGTALNSVMNDQFVQEIYEINWYSMTTIQQKVVLIMLMQSQNPKNIEIAGILPLSVATALRITKTIYSIFMMMLQFLVE